MAGDLDDESARAPTGSQVKAWLFGGASIPVTSALFDVEAYEGEIVSDLFGEDRYFADASARRGGVASVSQWNRVAPLFEPKADEAEAEPGPMLEAAE